ncbi:MAG TPA: hypothetical protein PKD64_12820 [Pirellulaceae bacterium]|nr:hypothetical protein [Pirellulaceae bacterium]HMO93070.1 hypothetical protein [Pirellulaceae bacterium]HMP69979.1 hypothetical protein [Pirellulaceae bacterium]
MFVNNLFGRLSVTLGIAMMLLGSLLVPVHAPVWGDLGGGTLLECDGHSACNTDCKEKAETPFECEGSCSTSQSGCEGCVCQYFGITPNRSAGCYCEKVIRKKSIALN